jgi:Protein of unknown function (DUF3047)
LRFACAIGLLALAAQAAPGDGPVTPFSRATPAGAIPAPWKALTLPNLKAPEFALVDDAGVTVLRVRAQAAAGSLGHELSVSPAERPLLSWRWKVDRVLDKADLTRKEGDDYAARVYVMFEVAPEDLSFADRARMAIAKLLYGADLPAAAICYVWDNTHPPGTTAWNTYSDRLRMVVVRSGPARVGQWVAESRDVDADFRAAFGAAWKKPTPRVIGVAVAADTDQTRESVTAWFGDLRMEARP